MPGDIPSNLNPCEFRWDSFLVLLSWRRHTSGMFGNFGKGDFCCWNSIWWVLKKFVVIIIFLCKKVGTDVCQLIKLVVWYKINKYEILTYIIKLPLLEQPFKKATLLRVPIHCLVRIMCLNICLPSYTELVKYSRFTLWLKGLGAYHIPTIWSQYLKTTEKKVGT